MNSLKMKSPETVLGANKLFTTTGKIMDVGNGVHLHRHILEIFAPNLKGQKTDFTDTTLHNHTLHSGGNSVALHCRR